MNPTCQNCGSRNTEQHPICNLVWGCKTCGHKWTVRLSVELSKRLMIAFFDNRRSVT